MKEDVAQNKEAPVKPPNVKTFYFSKEELEFLVPRQFLKNLADTQSKDADFVMKNFILGVVCPRCGIDVETSEVTFNVNEKFFTISPKIVPATVVPPLKK